MRLEFVALILILVGTSCGGGRSAPKKALGEVGQFCLPDGSCNGNLVCIQDRCEVRSDNNANNTNNTNAQNITPNIVANNSNNGLFCGDGVVSGTEQCDGPNLNGLTCADRDSRYTGGALRCNSSCFFDETGCTVSGQVCGDGVREGSELCESGDLGGASCITEGFSGGNLFCGFDCTFFDTSGCSNASCGNDFIEGNEVCDGFDLGGETCRTRGFTDGVLACNSACAGFVTTSCTFCGDSVVAGNEACDGSSLNGQTCASLGLGTGTLGCLADCSDYDRTGCASTPISCGLTTMPTSPPCDVNDLNICACEGCLNDNVCDPATDDCVCPDCRTDTTCGDASNCLLSTDGICEPWIEGCVCADCAAHPQCQTP